MSLLIKGMDMPKEPWECPCHNGENGRCNVTQNTCFEIPKDCPLVEVPTPHGDLIDRDVVRRKYQKMATDAYTVNTKAKMEMVINACIDQLEYTQTVIDSEE